MPKTIAITPSWYWPHAVPRVLGVPPFDLVELLVARNARRRPGEVALVGQDGQRLDWATLLSTVSATAGAIRERTPDGSWLTVCAGPSLEGAVLFLSAAASGRPARLAAPNQVASISAGSALTLADSNSQPAGAASEVANLAALAGGQPAPLGVAREVPAFAFTAADGSGVWQSNRSLLAGGLSFGAFLGGDGRPTVQTQPLWTWQGICALVTVLGRGGTLVLGDAGDAALECVGREGAGCLVAPLDAVADWTRDAKRQVKHLRGALTQIVLWTDGPFDPDRRRRVGKMFESPALTAWGLPETGPVFVSHSTWYVDESVGIPMTNAHVVPVEPRSGNPISTLWELVESARVTIYTPALTLGYDPGTGAPAPQRDQRFVDGRLQTSLIASSDANGMIYLLPD